MRRDNRTFALVRGGLVLQAGLWAKGQSGQYTAPYLMASLKAESSANELIGLQLITAGAFFDWWCMGSEVLFDHRAADGGVRGSTRHQFTAAY